MTGADAVLFDLDGVLVDSRRAFATSVNAALAEHGLHERDPGDLHPYLGPPLHDTFAELLGDGADADTIDALVGSYRARYRRTMADETDVVAGIPEVLRILSAELPLVVATSKPQAIAEPLLDAVGLRGWFGAVIGPTLEARRESKVATLGKALGVLPAHVEEPVMIGDRWHDVEAARAHKITSIGVLWGIGDAEELRRAGAHVLIEHPDELPDLLLDSPG